MSTIPSHVARHSRASTPIQFSERGSDYEPEEATIFSNQSRVSSWIGTGSNDQYSFLKLDKDKNQLRLLQLLPSDDLSSPIQCRLYVVARDDGPIYTALSYVWGDYTRVVPIKVNDLDWFVTENLFAALSNMREAKDPVTLWVDAICIDQKNADEKSWHVQRMRHTFAEAHNVYAWLGPADRGEESRKAVELVREIGRTILGHMTPDEAWSGSDQDGLTEALAKAGTPPKQDESELRHMVYELIQGHPEKLPFSSPAVQDIFECVYWSRVWILQEFAVSPSMEFFLGSHKLRVEILICVAALYNQYRTFLWEHLIKPPDKEDSDSSEEDQQRLHLDADALEPLYPQNAIRQAFHHHLKDPAGVPLTYILSSTLTYGSTCVLKATDPRDYVFALLGLAGDTQELGLIADYTKSSSEVFTNFARTMLHHGQFILLSWIRPAEGVQRNPELPSWAPDLSQRIKRPFQWVCPTIGNAESRFELEPSYSAGTNILTQGKILPPASTHDVLTVPQPTPTRQIPTLSLNTYAVDTIAYTGSSFSDLWARSAPSPTRTTHACIRILRELKSLVEDLLPATSTVAYASPFARVNAVWRTAVADIEMTPTWHRWRWRTELTDAHRELYDKGFPFDASNGQYEAVDKCFPSLESGNLGRRPFVTTSGLLGLAPEEALPGQNVLVVKGAQMPIVVEQVKGSGHWKMVGEAYVHGIMDGEIAERADFEWKEYKFV